MNLTNNYVQALEDLAFELQIEQEFLRDVENLMNLQKIDSTLFTFLANSIFVKTEKFEVIDLLASNNFNEYFINFLKVLVLKNDAHLLKEILMQYIRSYQQRKGIFWGKVFTTEPLSDQKLKVIQDVVSTKLSKKVMLKNIIDETLISGIKVEIDDRVFALSIASKLEQIKKDLYK